MKYIYGMSLKLLLSKCFVMFNLQARSSSHSPNRNQPKQILMNCHSCYQDHCPGHISKCQCSHHQCHSLHTLLHMGWSLCSRMIHQFHQHKGLGHNSSRSWLGILMPDHSCPGHISNQQHIHRHCRNLLP